MDIIPIGELCQGFPVLGQDLFRVHALFHAAFAEILGCIHRITSQTQQLFFLASNSSWVITPASRRPLNFMISSAALATGADWTGSWEADVSHMIWSSDRHSWALFMSILKIVPLRFIWPVTKGIYTTGSFISLRVILILRSVQTGVCFFLCRRPTDHGAGHAEENSACHGFPESSADHSLTIVDKFIVRNIIKLPTTLRFFSAPAPTYQVFSFSLILRNSPTSFCRSEGLQGPPRWPPCAGSA